MRESNDNKRAHTRHRVLKEGIVAFNKEYSTINCQVRDISATGAKLRVDDPGRLPKRFNLHIPVDGVKYAVEVRWVQSSVCGVEFQGEAERTHFRRSQHLEPSRTGDDTPAPLPVSQSGLAQPGQFSAQGQKKAFGRRTHDDMPLRKGA